MLLWHCGTIEELKHGPFKDRLAAVWARLASIEQCVDFDEAHKIGLIIGPVREELYASSVDAEANVKFRFLLCRGPDDSRRNCTILSLASIDHALRLGPIDAIERAMAIKSAVSSGEVQVRRLNVPNPEDSEYLRRAFKSQTYRKVYAEEFLRTVIATDIRERRKNQRLSVDELAQSIGIDASELSRIENASDHSMTVRTLLKAAVELKSSLTISFGGYGDLISESLSFERGSLQADAPQYSSCFISYSTSDEPFASRLVLDLQSSGVRCGFAPHRIEAGKKIHEQIDKAIHAHDRLLLILSTRSMSSEWVKSEIAFARDRELKEHRRILFPVSLVPFVEIREWKAFDADTGKDSAREIREYFIPDFSNWTEEESYAKAFSRLIRDLRAEK